MPVLKSPDKEGNLSVDKDTLKVCVSADADTLKLTLQYMATELPLKTFENVKCDVSVCHCGRSVMT